MTNNEEITMTEPDAAAVAAKKEKLAAYAARQGWRFGKRADAIIAAVLANDGNCPCRSGHNPCPCAFHREEIARDKHCHCLLFWDGAVTPEEEEEIEDAEL